MRPFHDRTTAGRILGDRLAETGRYGPDDFVLGLPRGGVPVAAAVADRLGCTLDVFVVRKLGAPANPEYAIGAIASGGGRFIDQAAVEYLRLSPEVLDRIEASERSELERREKRYRHGRPPMDVRGRGVILVDDGIATGASMLVAIDVLTGMAPATLTVAVPVAPRDTVERIARLVDHVVVVGMPEPFHAVGLWYDDFTQTSDDDVARALASR